jgi:hypothetical protein
MYKIGTTYLTASNTPATILWIESADYCRKAGIAEDSRLMVVLHQPYTVNERIHFHFLDGVIYGSGFTEGINLTEVEYIQEFKN